MKLTRIFAVLTLVASVSACAAVETATRAAPLEADIVRSTSLSFNVQDLSISVPRSLRVSEANLFVPGGDIVWREDPIGDRHTQVATIFEAGLRKGLSGMTEGVVPVRVEIEVTRFHALSEKARYTVGANHAVQFKMRLVNPETGIAYTEPRLFKADFKAYGGSKAIEAERAGLTQKVRITDRIAR